jgi:hypothetical protein
MSWRYSQMSKLNSGLRATIVALCEHILTCSFAFSNQIGHFVRPLDVQRFYIAPFWRVMQPAEWRERGRRTLGSDTASLPLPEGCSGRWNLDTFKVLRRGIISCTVVHRCQLWMPSVGHYNVSSIQIPRKVVNFGIVNKRVEAQIC